MPPVPEKTSLTKIIARLSSVKTQPKALKYFSTQLDQDLYEANSPLRNDAVYEAVLQYLLDSCTLDTASRVRYSSRLELVKKNQVGAKATDFSFVSATGEISSLYKITAANTILFFYEPDCRHCQLAIADLRANTGIAELIAMGKLSIVMVYAGGDVELWKQFKTRLPDTWTNGFDPGKRILRNRIYDLKASPTLYLLDEDKRVLLKDTTLPVIAIKLLERLS